MIPDYQCITKVAVASSRLLEFGINVKSRLVNLVLLPLRYGNKDIIRDNISECHR